MLNSVFLKMLLVLLNLMLSNLADFSDMTVIELN